VKFTIFIGQATNQTRYELDADPSITVLEALEALRGGKAPEILYRHSCHHGSCGTCGALVNGTPRLICVTKLGDLGTREIHLKPLEKMERLGGLAVWPGPFFAKLPDTDYLRPSTREAGDEAFDPDQAVLRLEDCIECGLCFSACPVEGEFLGPAALLAVAVEREKHPDREKEMLDLAGGPTGVELCEKRYECSKVCPQGLAPGRKIAELRKLLG